jgi:acetylornithine deacetylase
VPASSYVPHPVDQRVLAQVDPDEIVGTLADLVAIPSVDGTPGELDAQRWCAERMQDLGADVDLWDIDVADLAHDPDFPGMEVERDQAVGCVGVWGGHAGRPALALYGHTDVVPPGDLSAWQGNDPFRLRIDHGIAYGRGACDMKGGVAAILGAVSAVRRSGLTPTRPVAVHTVSAEEDGGVGAFATLRRGHVAGACISAEPTGAEVISANAGSLTFRLVVSGLSTHGSTRTRGVSAVELFEHVHEALLELEARRNATSAPGFEHLDLPWPLSVGTIAAGDWASTVPDRLVAEGRYGVRVDETVADAVADLETAVAVACAAHPWLREHPVEVTWPGGRFAPGRMPHGHPLYDEVAGCVESVTGRRPAALGGPYGSDLRHYAGAGVATLQYGPGDVRHAHASDEQVAVGDLVAAAQVYAMMIARRCT